LSATCGLDFERQISSSSFEVRRILAEALRELGFQITVDQLTRIEAKRGGMLGYSIMMKKQFPVVASFEVAPGEDGCTVVGRLTDGVKSIGKTWGANTQFRELFGDVQARVDLGLARLAGTIPESFTPARFWSRAGDIAVLEQTSALTSKAVGGAVGVASKKLEGSSDTTPKVWKGVDSVTFTSSEGVAHFTLPETQARLGVAVMIASHPGSMPANLGRDVETLAAAIEMTLTAAGGRATQFPVSGTQRPVFEFLNQQAEIRSSLPMRELHICRSCRLEKITNPEYERIVARNEKIGDIVAGVGATIGKGGISPTFVLGQLFKLKRLDPNYVCSRCQGMEADERVVTYCPNCADLARDVVLKACPKCKFDYRTKSGATPLWAEPEPEPEPQPMPTTSGWPVGMSPSPAAPALPASVKPPAWPPAAPALSPTAFVPPAPVSSPAATAPTAPTAPTVPTAPAAPLDVVPAAPSPAPAFVPYPVAVPISTHVPWGTSPTRPVTASLPVVANVAWPQSEQVPLGHPQIGSRGGKVCQLCRREFVSLWRVVISTPSGFEERFVCGSSTSCRLPAVTQPTQV
jgi:hypothetical protein